MKKIDSIRPQKISFVITKAFWGGAQRYVYDMATSFKEKGYSVAVVCGGEGTLVEKLRAAEVHVHTIPTLGRDIYPLQDFISFIKLVSYFLKERPDVAHLNSSKAGGLGALAGRLARVRTIIFTAHSWAFNEERPMYQKQIIRLLSCVIIMLSHKTIAVSKKTLTDLHAPGFIQKKITIIHNGITPLVQKNKDAFWEERGIHVDVGMRILSIGELHMSKGYDIAFSYLKKIKDIPWTYHILGDGDMRHELEMQVKKFGLEERVFFYGYVDQASSYIESFDLFLIPSRTEALGYVAIEALNTSIPIIAHNIGGIPEVLRRDTGSLLINPHDKNNIARIRSILNRTTVLPTDKREPLRIPFTKETMLAETEKVYL